MTMELSRLLSPEQTAAYLGGLAPQTLARWRCEGKGPRFVRLSTKRIAYRIADLEAWLAGRVASSTAEADRLTAI